MWNGVSGSSPASVAENKDNVGFGLGDLPKQEREEKVKNVWNL